MLEHKSSINITPVDLLTAGYLLVTGLFILIFSSHLENIFIHLFARFFCIILVFGVIWAGDRYNNPYLKFIRHFYPLLLIGFLYPETDYLNNVFFKNLDPAIADFEKGLFGGQPSFWFSVKLPWPWFSELMSFSYFSYYLLIFGFTAWLYFYNYSKFFYSSHLIFTSFYLYYIVFIIFPVAGPQFYFPNPLNHVPEGYLFHYIMSVVQELGERPTAALPSSHVGISLLIVFLSFKYAKPIFKYCLFAAILLCFSTVYLKAHYVVDVLAAFLTMPLFFFISHKMHILLFRQQRVVRVA